MAYKGAKTDATETPDAGTSLFESILYAQIRHIPSKLAPISKISLSDRHKQNGICRLAFPIGTAIWHTMPATAIFFLTLAFLPGNGIAAQVRRLLPAAGGNTPAASAMPEAARRAASGIRLRALRYVLGLAAPASIRATFLFVLHDARKSLVFRR